MPQKDVRKNEKEEEEEELTMPSCET